MWELTYIHIHSFPAWQATEDLKLGVERTTLGEMLMKKPKHERGHWLWVDSSATVLSAVETMVKANVGAILVMHRTVLDANQDGQVSDEELATANACKAIAGIVTERDYLKKMILQGRDAGTVRPAGEVQVEQHIRLYNTSG